MEINEYTVCVTSWFSFLPSFFFFSFLGTISALEELFIQCLHIRDGFHRGMDLPKVISELAQG